MDFLLHGKKTSINHWLQARGYVRLSLSAKLANHSAVFFSRNKSTNSTFSHGLSAKRKVLKHAKNFICEQLTE
jgi:hypothetical protein